MNSVNKTEGWGLWTGLGFLIALVAVVCIFNVGYSNTTLWREMTCHKAEIKEGEYWRCITYVVPHSDIKHLTMDMVYFSFVVFIAIQCFSPKKILFLWLLCGLAGSITFYIFDTRFVGTLGSSAATHGLLSLIVTTLYVSSKDWLLRTIYLTTNIYLLYISIYAIIFGVMGWPMTNIRNSGWDHFGGIIMGIILALSLHFYKRRNVAE